MIKKIMLAGSLVIWVNGWASLWEWDTMTVDTLNTGSRGTALALDSLGNPHIAYCRYGYEGLTYASWDTIDSCWIYEFVLDSVKCEKTFAGIYPSLALDLKGYPHISFRGGSLAYELGYTWKDSLGWHADSPNPGPRIYGTSIALDTNDYPHIGYEVDMDTGGVVLHTYWNGSNWVTEIVDTVSYTGAHWATICIDKWDTLHMAYGLLGYHYLKPGIGYAKRTGSEWVKEYIDTSSGYFSGCNYITINYLGYPCISYCCGPGSKDDYGLRYAEKTDTGWHIENVDTAWGEVGKGEGCALCFDADGNPHIAYRGDPRPASQDTSSLMYAWKYNGKWFIDEIDNKMAIESAVSYHYTGLAIDKDGYSHISYDAELTPGGGKVKYAKGKADTIGIEFSSPKRLTAILEIYPTIANRKIDIKYSIREEGEVNISIYDIAGRKSAELINSERIPGDYLEYLKIESMRGGVYFCVLKTGRERVVEKFIVIK